jgi:hypothetical protein
MNFRNLVLLAVFAILSLLAVSCTGSNTDAHPHPPATEPIPSAAPPQFEENSSDGLQSLSDEQVNTYQSLYPIVDTGQVACYDALSEISCPEEGESFFGQDAQVNGNQPQYQDNGDGTVTDLITGLTWTQSLDLNGDGAINSEDKLNYAGAVQMAESYSFAGYDDWRLPTIKELYSLINFSGVTGSIPYIDTDYFEFGYGDTSAGERYIDAQFATNTIYVSTVMNNQQAMFGVNLADGRIKGYGIGANPNYPEGKTFYVLFVRGNSSYGINDFVDNQNGTITDRATGLTWMQADNGEGVVWEDALNYCANLELAGITDWRLPDAKELQSIVDYSRSPDTTQSAASDPLFKVSYLPDGINNSGAANYPFFWTSTTHLDGRNLGARAVYISFGEARGIMNGQLMDVHGAGAQRSDPKAGDPSQFAAGFGPQGDVHGIYNFVRCVTGGSNVRVAEGNYSAGGPASQPQLSEDQQSQQPPQGQAPPQEAIDACLDLNHGSACSFSIPQGTISGQCMIVPSNELACVPEGGPPPGGQP